MPTSHRDPLSYVLAVSLWRQDIAALVPELITSSAGRDDVRGRVRPTRGSRLEMFRGTFEAADQAWWQAMALLKILGISIPHGEAAIPAEEPLALRSVATMSTHRFRAHAFLQSEPKPGSKENIALFQDPSLGR